MESELLITLSTEDPCWHSENAIVLFHEVGVPFLSIATAFIVCDWF